MSLFTILQYVLALVVFAVVVYFVSKYNRGVLASRVTQGKAQNPFPEFARQLGLTYEDISAPDTGGRYADKKTFMNTGSHVYGNYDGVPIDMVFAVSAREAQKIPFGATYAYSYSLDRQVVLTVPNTENKRFEILPKSANVVEKPTGVAAFDENLLLIGDAAIPREVLDYFGRLGWMNLQLKGQQLIFNDTFYDQFEGIQAGMKMLAVKHPVWGSTVQNTAIDVPRAKEALDNFVKIAKALV